jgi:hypothetical protein
MLYSNEPLPGDGSELTVAENGIKRCFAAIVPHPVPVFWKFICIVQVPCITLTHDLDDKTELPSWAQSRPSSMVMRFTV